MTNLDGKQGEKWENHGSRAKQIRINRSVNHNEQKRPKRQIKIWKKKQEDTRARPK